jgi:hypothetical protein
MDVSEERVTSFFRNENQLKKTSVELVAENAGFLLGRVEVIVPPKRRFTYRLHYRCGNLESQKIRNN